MKKKRPHNSDYIQCGRKHLNWRSGLANEHRKIFWILLWPKKEKTKPKDFADRWSERPLRDCPTVSIRAETFSFII